jgi:hypothetical protein
MFFSPKYWIKYRVVNDGKGYNGCVYFSNPIKSVGVMGATRALQILGALKLLKIKCNGILL